MLPTPAIFKHWGNLYNFVAAYLSILIFQKAEYPAGYPVSGFENCRISGRPDIRQI